MKLKLHLLITDDDNGNQSEIFTTAPALQDRQLELMRTLLEHDRAHGNGKYVAELGRLLELPLADPDVFKQAWDEFCEHQRNLNNYYNPTDTEIELPPEYDALKDALEQSLRRMEVAHQKGPFEFSMEINNARSALAALPA